jgi:serine/threonine protein kinase
MYAVTPRRSLTILLMALFLACIGCRGRRAEAVFSVPVARWSAELPGRSDPLDVTLPVHLDKQLPRSPVDYVLRTTVELPPDMRGRALTLAVPHMPALATLHVDGGVAVPIGESELDVYRATAPHRWNIPEEASRDGKVRLELRVQHRMSRSAWFDAVPVLTTDPRGGAWIGGVNAFNMAAAAGALASGIIVTLLYGFLYVSMRDKRRAAHGWFALGATCGMAYPAFVLGLTQPVFGALEGSFMTIALVLGSLAAMFFARAYVGAPPPTKAWWLVFGVVVVACVVVHNPFYSILVMGPLVLGVTLANAFAQLVFIVRLVRSGPRPSISTYAISFAWPFAVLLGLPDVLAWLGQGETAGGIRTACLGIMALSLYQGTALSREHLVALQHADALNLELGERVKQMQAKHREVELLNDELRRQIAARSRELAEKLAMMPDDGMDPHPPPALAPGDVVEGRYRIVKILGTGGMGTVYEVERIVDEKHFALKALAAGGDAQQRARFAREAQIVANVNNPNVVSIVDVDVAKSGFIFLVMELVTGGTTLHDVRKRHHDIPWTLGVLAQVAEGLDAIHAAGIVHRDLKPGNILLSRGADGRRPNVKITDFGISSLQPEGRVSSRSMLAREPMDSLPPASEIPIIYSAGGIPVPADEAKTVPLDVNADDEGLAPTEMAVKAEATVAEGAVKRGRSDRPPPPITPSTDSRPNGPRTPSSPLTETGIIFGTPQYMAQELAQGTKHATRASDVFALGIISFELLTGRRPFNESAVSAKLGNRPLPVAPSFRQMCPQLVPELATLLDRAMSHEPRDRPPARELAAALRALAPVTGLAPPAPAPSSR